jgi:hypothetical protein
MPRTMDPHPDSDPAPDPAFFVIDHSKMQIKNLFFKVFCLLLFEGTFAKIKSQKKSQSKRNQGFFKFFFAW